jgi:hypothetical protein
MFNDDVDCDKPDLSELIEAWEEKDGEWKDRLLAWRRIYAWEASVSKAFTRHDLIERFIPQGSRC